MIPDHIGFLGIMQETLPFQPIDTVEQTHSCRRWPHVAHKRLYATGPEGVIAQDYTRRSNRRLSALGTGRHASAATQSALFSLRVCLTRKQKGRECGPSVQL